MRRCLMPICLGLMEESVSSCIPFSINLANVYIDGSTAGP